MRPGNEIRTDTGRTTPDPRQSKQFADFPRVTLKRKGFAGAAFGGADGASLATLSTGFTATGVWSEPRTLNYELRITHFDIGAPANGLFEAEVMTALTKAGPNFGLPYVIGWTYTATTEEVPNEETGRSIRDLTTILITVQAVFNGSELTT